jgi:MFS family permease
MTSAPSALPIADPTKAEAPPVPLRHNRDFRLLWVGQAVSALGSNISITAYPLLVLALTGSAASAGLVGFLGSLPYALLQLPAGAYVDRWDRRRVMLVSDAVRGVTLAAVTVAVLGGRAPLPLLAVAAFIEGSLSVFFNAADSGSIKHIVHPSQLTAAMAQNEARIRGAAFIGRPLGGVLFGLGRAIPFLFDACTYLVSFLTLANVRANFNDERTGEQQHLVTEIKEGIVWLWRQSFLRACVLLVAGSNFMFPALSLTVVVLVRDEGASSAQIGLMLGGAGAGGLLGAFAAPWLQPKFTPRQIVVGANWIWTALIPLILLVHHPYVVMALMGMSAFVGPLWNVVIGTYEIKLPPDEMLGRVASVSSLFAWGVIPFGPLTAGLLIEHVGARSTLVALALWMLAIALLATVNRSIRHAPPLD